MPRAARTLYTASEFIALTESLGRRETVRPTPADLIAAAALVTEGRVVSAGDMPAGPALSPDITVAPQTPTPYRLSQWDEQGPDWVAVNDRLELDVHGATAMTHLDTTEHFSWAARPGGPRTPAGELVDLASTGLVGRGILIDVPGVLGVETAGQVITLADVRETLERTGVHPRRGDTVYFSFGRTERARSDVPLGSTATPGLSIDCAEWLADISPAAVVTDHGLDSIPGEVDGQFVPWHLIVLTVLRVPLIDSAMLVALSAACAELRRWEFLSVLAPLPIPGASGSPLNPLALF
jgi:kynurenine formamidase